MSSSQTKVSRPATRSAKRRASRKLSASQRDALAKGRAISATVNRYLVAVAKPGRRGRPVSRETLTQRLADARRRFKTEVGVNKVLAAQEIRDLQAKLTRLGTETAVDVKTLESAFIEVAKQFSEHRGVTYRSWRAAGVPAEVLKRAGIPRTRD